jgi:hypothetical protein
MSTAYVRTSGGTVLRLSVAPGSSDERILAEASGRLRRAVLREFGVRLSIVAVFESRPIGKTVRRGNIITGMGRLWFLLVMGWLAGSRLRD